MLKRTTSTGFTPSVVAVDQREDVEDPRDWDVQRVKVWAKALFNDEGIARKFEEEEIEGRTLPSERILSDASMDNLGLSTIGKKDKFATAVQDLFGSVVNHEWKKPKLVCTERFEHIDRILTNKEKDTFTSLDRSVYNTKKKKIIAFARTVWPDDQPTPWFRNSAENSKKLQEIRKQLAEDESYTFPRAGLGIKAIDEIIRKYM